MYLYILEYIKSYQSYSCITSPTHLQYATFCASSSRDSLVEDQCATVTSSHIWHMTQAYRDITNRKPTNAQRDATWHNVTQRDTTWHDTPVSENDFENPSFPPGHPPVSHGQYTANPSIQLERNRQSVHTASPYPNALLQQPQGKMPGSECLESEICLLKKNRLPGSKLQLSNVLIIHRS